MIKLFTILLLSLLSVTAFAQKRPKSAPPPKAAESSDILKADKLIEAFAINKKKFKIYCGFQPLSKILRQEKGDTLEVYKIVQEGYKISQMQITKFATREGKIITEGSYKIENNLLVVDYKSYDYIGAFQTTTYFGTDKWGLTAIKQDEKSINTKTLSDRYVLQEAMRPPPPAKN